MSTKTLQPCWDDRFVIDTFWHLTIKGSQYRAVFAGRLPGRDRSCLFERQSQDVFRRGFSRTYFFVHIGDAYLAIETDLRKQLSPARRR